MQFAVPAADDAQRLSRVALKQPLLKAVRYWIQLRLFQFLLKVALWRRKQPASEAPTYSKAYSVRPHLPVRVFIPPSYKPGNSKPLPLHIDVHGGGFALCDPRVDDRDNSILSGKHGICVVSVAYSLAPRYPWPTAVYDVAAVIEAILADETLPVDKARVSVGGYSAGGNLSLTAVQVNDLNKRIKAVVAIYPSCDWQTSVSDKLADSKLAPGRKEDMLLNLSPAFQWAYVNVGTKYSDPLLSPIAAKREALPQKLFFLGCEYDMLCGEARKMAENMAVSGPGKEETADTELSDGWVNGDVRWMHLKSVEHGFNMVSTGISSEKLQDNRRRGYYMHEQIAGWLYNEVYERPHP